MKKILLDTNIIVPLEDAGVVPELYSRLLRKLAEKACTVFVHRASYDDIHRDKDENRRTQSISKLQKYAAREKSDRTTEQLEALFGTIASANDEADCQILSAAYDNAVDALVTEDNEIHRRARKAGVHERVFRVNEMLDFLGDREEGESTNVSFVEARYCYQVNAQDKIFDSLADDYPNFSAWWQKCCKVDRRCWLVRDQASIAGIVVYNDESANGGDGRFSGKKVLKICTFKVSENHRGGRLGEQLLKQSIWYAFSHDYDVAYLTVFPKQTSLIDLLCYYGFFLHSTGSELVYAKDFRRVTNADDEFDWHVLNYPRLVTEPRFSAIIPIRSHFHKRLLPEASAYRLNSTPDFFEGLWSAELKDHHIPATTIRKVYVCKAQLKLLPRGTRLYFYASKNEDLHASQGISAVGVLEGFHEITSSEQLLQLTAKRSVYRASELMQIFESGGQTRVVSFVFSGTLKSPISLNELVAVNVLRAAPQTITRLSVEASTWLSNRSELVYLTQ